LVSLFSKILNGRAKRLDEKHGTFNAKTFGHLSSSQEIKNSQGRNQKVFASLEFKY